MQTLVATLDVDAVPQGRRIIDETHLAASAPAGARTNLTREGISVACTQHSDGSGDNDCQVGSHGH